MREKRRKVATVIDVIDDENLNEELKKRKVTVASSSVVQDNLKKVHTCRLSFGPSFPLCPVSRIKIPRHVIR